MTKYRLKKIIDLLINLDKQFNVESWENGEGKDIIVEGIIIAVPDDFEQIVRFEPKENFIKHD